MTEPAQALASHARPRLPRWRPRIGRLLAAVAYIAGLVLIWELFVAASGIRSYLLPAPSAIWAAFLQEADTLARHSWITLLETILGFALAAVVGVILATVIVYSPRIAFLLLPTLVATNATPKVVFAPILVIWLGLGLESKVAMAFLLSFFPIVINATRGLGDVPRELMDLFRLLQASGVQSFIKVRLPNAMPAIFDGLKIAMPLALIGAVVGEFVAARQGIGNLMLIAYSNFNTPLVFAAVIVVAVLATLLFQALVVLERLVLGWRPGPRV